MKKHLSKFLLLSCLLFFSCTKQSIDSVEKSNVQEQLKNVGKVHNETLYKIFTKLKSDATLRKSMKAGMFARSSQVEGEFYNTVINTTAEEILDVYTDYSTNYQNDYAYAVNDMKTFVFGFYYGQIDPIYDSTFNDVAPLSSELETAVNNLKAKIDNAPDVQTIKNIIQAEYQNVNNLSNEIDRFAFEGTLNVGLSSADYWSENLDDWYALLLPDDQIVNLRQVDGVQVLKDALWGDMGGFVRGAIKGAVRGVWGGIQSAAVAGLVTGAYQGIVGSAGGAIEGTIRSWLGW